jgi:parallel beta-helix repeat protein
MCVRVRARARPSACQVCDRDTSPLVDGNTITESRAGGVLVLSGATPLLRKNTIHSNRAAGVRLAAGSRARLEDNTIRDGGDCGVALCSGTKSTLVGNAIRGHPKANMIVYGAETVPILLRNTVEHGEQAGVYVYAAACPVIEDCELRGNTGPNLLVTEGANPCVMSCLIHSSDDAGVLVHQEVRAPITR